MPNPWRHLRSAQVYAVCSMWLLILWIQVTLINSSTICNVSDISFFNLLQWSDGGWLGNTTDICHQTVTDHNTRPCSIYLLKEYTPHNFLQSKIAHKKCDNTYSSMVNTWFKSAKSYSRRPGLPYLQWKDKKSIGKFLRFNALMQYESYKGTSSDVFIDFDYKNTKLGFPWTDSVHNCTGSLAGWNCGFVDFSAHLEYEYRTDDAQLASDITMDRLNYLRRNKKEHVMQLPIYGKFIELLMQPSEFVQQFMVSHVRSINHHVWEYRHMSSFTGAPNNRTFNSYEELWNYANYDVDFYGNSPSKHLYSSVGMHVRRGDSCDNELDELVDIETVGELVYAQSAKGEKRPCFSINLYMKMLHRLRELYNVKRVFLSTDDQAMVNHAIMNEPAFNWVLVQSDRSLFDHGLGWIEFRNDNFNEQILLLTISDLNLLSFGDVFLGAFSSQYSKLGYYAIAGRSMSIPPFVSMDVPLMCEPYDNCTTSFIKEHQSDEWLQYKGRDMVNRDGKFDKYATYIDVQYVIGHGFQSGVQSALKETSS